MTPPEAQILSALGVDPAMVQAGTLKIIYDGAPDPILSFTLVQRVPTADLAKAMNGTVEEKTEINELGDGCVGEHSPGSNEDCTFGPESPPRPTLVREEMSPEVRAQVNAELQRLATEGEQQ